MAAEHRLEPVPQRLVLFDGECGFCDWAVGWLLARDRLGVLHFAPLQGETAARLRVLHPEIPTDTDTMVYVVADQAGERVYLRSQAVFRVMEELPGAWRFASRLGWLPRAFTDGCYRLFARHRYRLFGKVDACSLPPPEQRARFVA
ncbi:MAG: thiol-disulfide oxidoreductase DCC family protein [Myxococcota bacterium]